MQPRHLTPWRLWPRSTWPHASQGVIFRYVYSRQEWPPSDSRLFLEQVVIFRHFIYSTRRRFALFSGKAKGRENNKGGSIFFVISRLAGNSLSCLLFQIFRHIEKYVTDFTLIDAEGSKITRRCNFDRFVTIANLIIYAR